MGLYNVGAGKKAQMGKESAYGTSVTPTVAINFTGESINTKVEKKDEASLLSGKAPLMKDIMRISVDGNLPFALRPEFAGFLFRAAFGGTDAVAQNSPVTGANTHTMKLVDNATALPTYTLVIDRGQAVKKFSGCKIDQFQVSAKIGEFVTGSISIKGKDEAGGSVAGLSDPVLKAFKCVNASLVAGGTTFDVSKVDFTLRNNLFDVPNTFGNGVYPPEPMHGIREATISIEMPYDANAETARTTNFLAETLISSIVLTLESASMVTGTTPYKIVLTLNNVSIIEHQAQIPGPGVITAKISGVALAVGATEPVQVVVTDAQATAY